jgi:uncharacterized protein YndB with AHSA1/START domain
MNSSATSDFLGSLRSKYLAQLRDRRGEITGFLDSCEQGDSGPEAREAARKLAHNLAGSGATYGFSRISTAARAMEAALQPGEEPESGILAKLTRTLLEECDRATGRKTAPAAPAPVSSPRCIPAAILHRMDILASGARIFEALTTSKGLSGWWIPGAVAESKVGSIAEFPFVTGVTKMRIDILKPESCVGWTCVAGPEEWLGTEVKFDLTEEKGRTILRFSQRGWKEASDFYARSNSEWGYFLYSLKSLMEEGQGKPFIHRPGG